MPLQQLPNWIQSSAFLLALNAGMLNVMGLITVLHQSISHMTGNVSLFAMALWSWNLDTLLYLGLITLCFVIGSFYSGLILGNGPVRLGKSYGVPLTLVSLFIFLCWVFLPYFPRYALLWASTAMGVQNAMVSHYRGTIIRTTHLSGVLTDLGLAFGYLARGLKVDPRRLILHFLILFGFLLGGILAAILYHYLHIHAFLIPALLTGLMSILYWFLYLRRD